MIAKYFIKNAIPRCAAAAVLLAALSGCATHAHADDLEDFWIAVQNDRPATVQKLLARGAITVNTPTPATNPPLIEAIKFDSWAVYDLLLKDPHINLNQKNAVGETPLMYLAIKGETDRMRALIDRGAEVNQPGWTALHYAATKGYDDAVRLLLDHYAYIDAEAPDKTTPLMMAMKYNHPSTVKLLLDEGADGYFRNAAGKNAADVAREAGNTILANDFVERLNAERRRKLGR
ncbi:ankyrin repeat domain-containing protein [Pigmentiphaga soli]